MDTKNLVLAVALFAILFLFQWLEALWEKTERYQQYVDDRCRFTIRRNQPITGLRESGMTQPLFRPCSLGNVFIQNCRGQFLNITQPDQPLKWEAQASNRSCFLIVKALSPQFESKPGFFSIKSMNLPGFYLKNEDNRVVLKTDPRSEVGLECKPPLHKDFVFGIRKGWAKFNGAFSLYTFDDKPYYADSDFLSSRDYQPERAEDKVAATFYFGPNRDILGGRGRPLL